MVVFITVGIKPTQQNGVREKMEFVSSERKGGRDEERTWASLDKNTRDGGDRRHMENKYPEGKIQKRGKVTSCSRGGRERGRPEWPG